MKLSTERKTTETLLQKMLLTTSTEPREGEFHSPTGHSAVTGQAKGLWHT